MMSEITRLSRNRVCLPAGWLNKRLSVFGDAQVEAGAGDRSTAAQQPKQNVLFMDGFLGAALGKIHLVTSRWEDEQPG